MASYLLIASRDPFRCNDVPPYLELAGDLSAAGNEVTVMLVQNGVLPARRSGASAQLSELAAAGVTVLADRFSLRERGIADERLAEGIQPAELDVVIDHLEAGSKTLWH